LLKEIHILLTYGCTYECDHCFQYSSPRSEGTFTRQRIAEVLDAAAKLKTIEWIYFEGGEPFLYYALMIEGLGMARDMGFKTGIVTNGYWATSEEDAEIWLRPLIGLGVSDLSMSEDGFHGDGEGTPVKAAIRAARKLGLPVGAIRIDAPACAGGGSPVRFRGRAVDRLTGGLALKPENSFVECPYEDLRTPERVHVDPFGNVHFCQGLSIGNMWKTPLGRLFAEYRPEAHPICGPLLEGGPTCLARTHGVAFGEGYVDACHHCFLVRRALIDRFPQYLGPRQVYGLDDNPTPGQGNAV